MLAAGWSWRWGNAAIALVLAALALAYFATRNVWSVASPFRGGRRAEVPPPPGAPRRSRRGRRCAFRRSGCMWPTFFVLTGLEATAGQWSYTVLTEARGMAPSVAGVCVGGFWAAFTLARILAGAVVGAHRRRAARAPRAQSGCWRGWCCSPRRLTGLPVMPASRGFWLTGLALGPLFPGLMAETPRRLGAGAAAHAVGFQVAAAVVGMAALPALAGSLAHGFGLDAAAAVLVPAAVALRGVCTERIMATTGGRPSRDR